MLDLVLNTIMGILPALYSWLSAANCRHSLRAARVPDLQGLSVAVGVGAVAGLEGVGAALEAAVEGERVRRWTHSSYGHMNSS